MEQAVRVYLTVIGYRRLRDGITALASPSDLTGMSESDLRELRAVLYNGALALQSLEVCGSTEANKAVCADLDELQRRMELVDEALMCTPKRHLRDPNTKVVIAPTDAVDRIELFVHRVMTALQEVLGPHVRGAMITDESCVSDFFDYTRDRSKDGQLYAQLGQKLCLELDPARNPDDRFIAKIAERLKEQ